MKCLFFSLLMATTMSVAAEWYYLPLSQGEQGAGLAISVSRSNSNVLAGVIFQPGQNCTPTLSIRLVDKKMSSRELIKKLDLEISYQVDERTAWQARKNSVISEKTIGGLNNYVVASYDFLDELLTGSTLNTNLKYPGGSRDYQFNLEGSNEKIATAHSECTKQLFSNNEKHKPSQNDAT